MKMLTMMMVLGLAASVATAATVEVWIQDRGWWPAASSNMWFLVASCSPDCGGIAVFDVPLTDDWTNIVNKSALVSGSVSAGFTEVRSGNDVSPVNGGQKTIDASATMIYGIGQGVVDITQSGSNTYIGAPSPPTQVGQALGTTVGAYTLTKPAGSSYTYGVVLAQGKYGGTEAEPGTLPSIDTSFTVSFNVFEDTTTPPGTVGGITELATTVILPEPATICLLVMGGLALIRRKR